MARPRLSLLDRARTTRSDIGVAVLCVLVFWLPIGRTGGSTTVHTALIVLVAVGLLARSRWPLAAFGIVTAATLAGAVLGLTHDPFVAAAWTLYPVAGSSARVSAAISAALGVFIALVALAGTADAESAVRYTLLSILVLVGAWKLGNAAHRERAEGERAARDEHDRAVAAERFRVVREVHDVVSHSLGTIAVTSGVAAHIGSGDAEGMRHKLGLIEETSKQALAELRAVLGAVRDHGERAPQPGVSDLPKLIERAGNAGIQASLTVAGGSEVPAGIGLAVYRIVQEGLTNTIRHAPGSRCEVTVIVARQEIHVAIVDDGAGRPADCAEGGHGLAGLRERVTLLGGDFTAGSRPEGGFAVRAVLPEPVG